MVIGSAQSGMQIVDDLLDAGREVLLSTGKAGRVPRRYRGRDLNYWYDKLGLMDRRAGDQMTRGGDGAANRRSAAGTAGTPSACKNSIERSPASGTLHILR